MKKRFKEKVLQIVSGIPKGEAMTYKQVASEAGCRKAYRVVGNILKNNEDQRIPCHRVIRSDGSIGGYNKGKEKKKALLEKEGFL